MTVDQLMQLENFYKLHEHKTNHILHLLISLIFFPWLFVWIITAASNGTKNKELRERLERSYSSL